MPGSSCRPFDVDRHAPRPPALRPVATMVAIASVLAVGTLLGACSVTQGSSDSSSTLSSASSDPTTPTTAPLSNEVAVAFPVVACSTSVVAGSGTGTGSGSTGTGGTGTGGSGSTTSTAPDSTTTPSTIVVRSPGWIPSILLAPIPTALVGKVEFYSDGTHTVLAPTGWTCTRTESTDGAPGLVVYPTASPDPPIAAPVAPGAEGVFATFDTTGHAAGIAAVCPFFTVPTWQQQEAKCSGTRPSGEQVSMPTPDVASVTDPAGVVGSLTGSGGQEPVTGTVIFPQITPAVTDGSSIDIATESCSLPQPTLCPTVLSDFDVREFPVPASSATSAYGSR